MKIVEINDGNKKYHNIANEPFTMFGKLDVTFKDNRWHHDEVLYDDTMEKYYDDEVLDLEDYISSSDKTVFYAFEDDQVLGQIIIRKHWNGFCYIDDIGVRNLARKKGVGRKLLEAAEIWAKTREFKGFMLETQDVNLGACKFYIRTGFVLGGVDVMLYNNCKTKDEKALFWYKKFE